MENVKQKNKDQKKEYKSTVKQAMDYVKEISELREKLSLKNLDANFIARSELYHREVQNELLLKREQVVHLKKELELANAKIFEQNRTLDTNQSLLKDSEFNLKLALQKSTTVESKFSEVNKNYIELKLKEEMRISDIEILKGNVQKLARENHQLSREVEEFQDKLKYSRAFQDDLENRQTKINTIVTKMKENCEKLEKEHVKVTEIEASLQKDQDFKNLCELLKQENEKVHQNYNRIENELIEVKAKYKKLENLINQANKNSHHEDVLSRIKYLQWESHYKKLKEKNAANENIISSLTATLNEEISTNAQLLAQNEEYENRIQELENKLPKIKIIKPEVESEEDIIEIE